MKAISFPNHPRFEEIRRIGAGGMGVVFEAFDREYQEEVALKVLRWNADGDRIKRFKNEFRSLQGLRHKNLVNFIDMLEHEGQWFFTMQYVDGVDFIEAVRPSSTAWVSLRPELVMGAPGDITRPIPMAAGSNPELAFAPTQSIADASLHGAARETAFHEDRARRSTDVALPYDPNSCPVDFDTLRDKTLQLVAGLGHLHQAGTIHRDLKPANILVDDKGRVVILDFGLAARAGKAESEEILGTPDYMAPEQVRSMEITAAGDWYSLGVILFESLTGRLPFVGSPLEVLEQKQNLEAARPSTLLPGIPKRWDDLCFSLLQRDPQKRPSQEAIVEMLGVRKRRLPYPQLRRAQDPSLVGRSTELAVLERAMQRVDKEGAPQLVFVHGESGIGKSLLVSQFVDHVSSSKPFLHLEGRCFERESVPYKAVDGVVDALADALGHMPPEEAAALLPKDAALLLQAFPILGQVRSFSESPPVDLNNVHRNIVRLRVFEALGELLSRLAETRHVLLTIDDFQWTDQDSLDLLRSVMGAAKAPKLILCATIRTPSDKEQAKRMEERLRFSADIEDLRLGGLEEKDCHELVRSLCKELAGDNTGIDLQEIVREADGHPLFADVLVRHYLNKEQVQRRGAQSDSQPISQPSSKPISQQGEVNLEEALQQHVDGLPIRERDVLQMLAVAGRPISREVAAHTLNISLTELIERVDVLLSKRLLRSDGARNSDKIEPYHSRVREVARKLPKDTLRSVHSRLAIGLRASSNADPELVAFHFEGAGEVGRAIEFVELAAQRASEAHAYDRAARLCQESVRLRQDAGEPLAGRWEKLGDALVNAGRGEEASEALCKAAELVDPYHATELRHRAGEQLLFCGKIGEGVALLTPILASYGFEIPSSMPATIATLLRERALLKLRFGGMRFRARAPQECSPQVLHRLDVLWSVSMGFLVVDPLRFFIFQTMHLRLALRAGESSRVARGLCTEAIGAAAMGAKPKVVSELLKQASDLAALSPENYENAALLETSLGTTAHLQGRFSDAYQHLSKGRDLYESRCEGVTWEIASIDNMLRWGRTFLGKFDELREETREAVRLAEVRNDRYAAILACSGLQNLAWLLDGEPQRARELTTTALSRWSFEGFHLQHMFDLYAQVQIDLYEGKSSSAHKRLQDAWPLLQSSGTLKGQLNEILCRDLRARVYLAEARSATMADTDRRKFETLARRESKWLRKSAHQWAAHLADLMDGQLAEESNTAKKHFASAQEGFSALGMQLHAQVAAAALRAVESDAPLVAEEGWSEAMIAEPERLLGVFAPALTLS